MVWPEPKKKSQDKKSDVQSEKPKEQKIRTKDPMEGVTLLMVLERLEDKYGWDELASRIRINCFAKDPSIKSSLKFLRRTPWARKKVEELYLSTEWD